MVSPLSVDRIARDKLEARVLNGLRDRLMTPEIAAEAIRAYVEESNRLNHQRRASEIADRTELEKVLKAIKGLVTLAEEGKGTRTLVDHLLELEHNPFRLHRTDCSRFLFFRDFRVTG